MGRAKSIVHVDVCEGGKLAGEFFVVGFFFSMKAQVFQQEGLAFLQIPGHLLCRNPTQSGANPTLQLRPSLWSRRVLSRSATGLRLILGLGLPLGRPR